MMDKILLPWERAVIISEHFIRRSFNGNLSVVIITNYDRDGWFITTNLEFLRRRPDFYSKIEATSFVDDELI